MERDFYVNTITSLLENTTGSVIKPEVVDEYLTKWETAKAPWIKRFNGTIYSYPTPISFTLDEATRGTLINNFLTTTLAHVSESAFTYGSMEFLQFFDVEGVDITSNIVPVEYVLPDKTVIPKGMKLLRAFKFFFNDKDMVTYAQNEMNIIISKCKFNGTLHISVDPLDYLTISENNYGWRSCHALDGDYAAGNLEYMMDTATLVCYIDDNAPVELHNFPNGVLWNNKKWRMLLFVSDDGENIFAGREYPTSLMDKATWDILLHLFQQWFPKINYVPDTWDNDYMYVDYSSDNYQDKEQGTRHVPSVFERCLYPLKSLYTDVAGESRLFYDDVLTSTCYKEPYYLLGIPYKTSQQCRTLHPVRVGVEQVTCPHCGKKPINNGTESFWCVDCELSMRDSDWMTCECCGRHYLEEDEGAWLVDDSWWCDRCIADNAVTCAQCGGLCNIENAYYDEEREIYICNYCKEDTEWQ